MGSVVEQFFSGRLLEMVSSWCNSSPFYTGRFHLESVVGDKGMFVFHLSNHFQWKSEKIDQIFYRKSIVTMNTFPQPAVRIHHQGSFNKSIFIQQHQGHLQKLMKPFVAPNQ